MLSNVLNPGVVFIAGVALTITALSVYVSRIFLPAKIKEAYRKSITALAAAVETKDSGTVGHAQRVASLTVEVARRLGMGSTALERLEYAALLRDIGKAGVPQRVLTRTDPLTDKELDLVHSHVILGEEMVASSPFLADIAPHIRHHHEYWDGTGYPDGLKGEDISLEARILAVASDFDAMVSDRPYHPVPMEPEQALEEIRSGSGIKYDPMVATMFIKLIMEELAGKQSEKQAA